MNPLSTTPLGIGGIINLGIMTNISCFAKQLRLPRYVIEYTKIIGDLMITDQISTNIYSFYLLYKLESEIFCS